MLKLKTLLTPDDYKIARIMSLAATQSKPSTENHIWVTAQGNKIPVRQMSTNHIRNTIKCWNGQGKLKIPSNYLGGKTKWLKILNDELIARQ